MKNSEDFFSLGPMDDPATEWASEMLFENACDYLNSGLALVLAAEASSRDAKVAVLALQTAIELLLKYRLVTDGGLASIVEGTMPGDVDLRQGKFKTISFGDALKLISEEDQLNGRERSTIVRLQRLRNRLIHFTADIDVEEVRITCAFILVRALGMFALGPERDAGEMVTYAQFLDPENFEALLRSQPYRREALRLANHEKHATVQMCWTCENRSLLLRDTGVYFCHTCGFAINSVAVSYSNCCSCKGKGTVFFDSLNDTHNMHYGKCIKCEVFQYTFWCPGCGYKKSQNQMTPPLKCPNAEVGAVCTALADAQPSWW